MFQAASPRPASPHRRRVILGLAILVVAGWCAAVLSFNLSLEAPAQLMRSGGVAGPVLYLAAYTVSAFLALPVALLTMFAGYVYGPSGGFMLALPTATLAAAVHFSVIRRFGRGWAQSKLKQRPRLAAIDRFAGSRGLQLVLLLRLSPVVPFAALNYAMAISQVRFSHFIVGSVIGKTPVTLLHVYLASAVFRVSELSSPTHTTGPAGDILFWVGLVATVLATAQLTWAARAKTATLLSESEVEP